MAQMDSDRIPLVSPDGVLCPRLRRIIQILVARLENNQEIKKAHLRYWRLAVLTIRLQQRQEELLQQNNKGCWWWKRHHQ